MDYQPLAQRWLDQFVELWTTLPPKYFLDMSTPMRLTIGPWVVWSLRWFLGTLLLEQIINKFLRRQLVKDASLFLQTLKPLRNAKALYNPCLLSRYKTDWVSTEFKRFLSILGLLILAGILLRKKKFLVH